ncbi:hypothetical protein [Pilimelia terevasa]|uniref:hypothetical protein n=1 Tax=Pilimelia terevasa TaxID=53372 RepID=UPI0016686C2A|nr:hypothetical protein [Pilimelia terevasa]
MRAPAGAAPFAVTGAAAGDADATASPARQIRVNLVTADAGRELSATFTAPNAVAGPENYDLGDCD